MCVMYQKKTSTVKHQKPLNANLFQTNQTPPTLLNFYA